MRPIAHVSQPGNIRSMRMIQGIAAAFALTALPLQSAHGMQGPQNHAPSGEPKLSANYERCMDKSEGVTVEMHDCISAEYDRQDARLNTAYKVALARMTPTQQTRLRELERGWLKATKTSCDHAGDENAGGTGQAIQISDCYLSETAKRADVLARYKP
ncbi:MAG: hypothetical protein JWM33_913 [Caulobacteraceae bacterium]|nr:hypothetical protein [Caulobacteraceae bacterium]